MKNTVGIMDGGEVLERSGRQKGRSGETTVSEREGKEMR